MTYSGKLFIKWGSGKLQTSLVVFSVIALSMLSQQALALDRDQAFSYPVRAFNNGNYDVAIKGFNEFLGAFPEDTRAKQVRFWKAETHLHQNNHKQAFKTLMQLHDKHPTFKEKQILYRMSYLANKLGREEAVLKLYSTRKLKRYPRLQNYLIKWRLDSDQIKQLSSQLSLIPEPNRTDSTRKFLSSEKKSELVKNLQSRLSNGEWNTEIAEQMRRLPLKSRKSLLVFAVKSLWDNDQFQTILDLGNKAKSAWQSAEFHLYRAESAIRLDKFKLAKSIYNSLQGQPKYHSEIKFNLGWLNYRSGNLETAKDLLEQVDWNKVNESFSAQALKILGDIALSQENYANALTLFKQSRELNPSPALENEIEYGIGWAYFKTNRLSKAEKFFNEVKSDTVVNAVNLYSALGKIKYSKDQLDPAEEFYRKALEQVENPAKEQELQYELARILYKKGSMNEAYTKLTGINVSNLPRNIQGSVYMALARTALAIGKNQKAWEIFTQNKDLLRDEFPKGYLFYSGKAAEAVEDYKKARQYLGELIETYPNSSYYESAIRLRFQLELARTESYTDERHSELVNLIEQSPPQNRLNMYQKLADELQQKQLQTRARNIYEKIVKSTDQLSIKGRAVNEIVEISLKLDQSQYAEKYLNDIGFFNHPRVIEAWYRLTHNFYRSDNEKKVKKYARQILDQFQTSTYHKRLHFMLGELDRRSEQYDKALEHYRAVLEYDLPEKLRIRVNYRLGGIYYKRKEWEEALDAYSKIQDRSNQFINSRQLSLRLAEINLNLENFQTAKQLLEPLDLRDNSSRFLRVKILFNSTEYEQAREELNQIEAGQNSTFQPKKMFWLGRIDRAQGKTQRAIDRWYQTIYTFPQWSDLDQVLYELSELLRNEGNNSEAKKLTKRLKSEFPESEYVTTN